MKVFLSWSRTRSKMVAAALNEWLPQLIQAVEPFFSPNIPKGAQWGSELDSALEGTRFGIVCLTPENLENPWILYEAGALSKLQGSRVWTFIINLRPSNLTDPLAKFQATSAEKSEVRQLVEEINLQLGAVGEKPVPLPVLNLLFEKLWSDLEQRLNEAANYVSKSGKRSPVRDSSIVLDEILDGVRALERRLNRLESAEAVAPVVPLPARVRVAPESAALDHALGFIPGLLRAIKEENFDQASSFATAIQYVLPSDPNLDSLFTGLSDAFKHGDPEAALVIARKLRAQLRTNMDLTPTRFWG